VQETALTRRNAGFIHPGSISRQNIHGNAGSIYTAKQIARLIKEGTNDFNMRQHVVGEMLRGVPEKDKEAEIYAIHEWVRNNLTYRHDPVGVDLVIGAPKILEMVKSGVSGFDCDDMVVFEGAALRIAGIPVDLVILKSNASNPNSYSHIYLMAYDLKKGKAIPLDPIMKGITTPAGWEAPVYYKKKFIKLDGLANQFGLGAYEHERALSLRYIPKQFPQVTNPSVALNHYISQKKHFYAYLKRIMKAFEKDIQNITKDKSKNEQQKNYMYRDMVKRKEGREKKIRENHEPIRPAFIPNNLFVEFLREQNKRLTAGIMEATESKRLAIIFRKIGNDYLERLREAELRIQRRALRRAKHSLKHKIFREIGAVALAFIPAIGMIASMGGSMGNMVYEMKQKEKQAEWMNSAIKAAEAALGPGTAEIYLLEKADDIEWKANQILQTIDMKIEFNNFLIEQLSTVTPRKWSTAKKVAVAGTGAAGLLWMLL
jgi:hypothetical protein